MSNPVPKLTDRAQQILRALIEQYIEDGQPIGSRSLAKRNLLSLSPATIRNVMSELEEMGFLWSPHTSAGRVPTDLGYRFFVDSLVQVQPLQNIDMQSLEEAIGSNKDKDSQALVAQVSGFLSGVTQMAGIVTMPKRETPRFRHIEFLPLTDRRVLAILVINNDEVQNRILNTDRDYQAAELENVSNIINKQFVGKEVSEMRSLLKGQLESAREAMNKMLEVAVDMAGQVLDESQQEREEFVVAGQTNLMGLSELSNVEKLRALFEEFTRKRDMYDLLERCVEAQGIQIFIGRESGFSVFDECSLIAAPYSNDADDVAGVIGVIGPTRMAYEKIIPIVDVTSKLLSAALRPRD